MTAKEMFEELGYEYEENILYITYTMSLGKTIRFDKDSKILEKYVVDNYCNKNSYGLFSLKELKAINKQVEELGWLND